MINKVERFSQVQKHIAIFVAESHASVSLASAVLQECSQVCFFLFLFSFCLFVCLFVILYVNCFGRTMLHMCIEYHI